MTWIIKKNTPKLKSKMRPDHLGNLHFKECQYYKAAMDVFKAAMDVIGIECEHGYDCCPICDPCTCKEQK